MPFCSALLPGRAGRRELGVDDPLQRPGQAQPAEPLGVVDPGQAGVEAGVEEVLLGHGLRVVTGQELAGPLAELSGRHHDVFLTTVLP